MVMLVILSTTFYDVHVMFMCSYVLNVHVQVQVHVHVQWTLGSVLWLRRFYWDWKLGGSLLRGAAMVEMDNCPL